KTGEEISRHVLVVRWHVAGTSDTTGLGVVVCRRTSGTARCDRYGELRSTTFDRLAPGRHFQLGIRFLPVRGLGRCRGGNNASINHISPPHSRALDFSPAPLSPSCCSPPGSGCVEQSVILAFGGAASEVERLGELS